jgi:formylglycine-generating enzyme required for sulfatase activity
MALIPAGEIVVEKKRTMVAAGSGALKEMPEKRATVAAFCLDYVEVDVAHFGSCAGSVECTPESKRLPVEVSYAAAVAHCASRNKRVPTAREWKYAAGGQFNWTCPWGDCWDGKILADGVCWKRTESDGPCEVGTNPRDVSPQGVRDLAGNLSEWVQEDPKAFVRWRLANEDPPADPGAQISVLGIGGARYTVPARPLFFYFDPRFFEDDGRKRAAIRCATEPQMLPVSGPSHDP